MFGSRKAGETTKTLHNSDNDYNDSIIASGAYLFIRIAEDRLKVKLLD